MFLSIQRKMNYLLILVFAIIALILYGVYVLINTFTDWGFLGILLPFILIIMVAHILLSFVMTHIEATTIYRMIAKKKIALAKIKKATPYATSRDLYFNTHNVYQIEIELYTQDHIAHKMTIYEDVKNIDFSVLPAYAYVTCDTKMKQVGLVPTFTLYMTPILKDIVSDFEKEYKPKYVEIVKKRGLTIQAFGKKTSKSK